MENKKEDKKKYKYKIVVNFETEKKISEKMMDYICKEQIKEFVGKRIKKLESYWVRVFEGKTKSGIVVYFDAKCEEEAEKIKEEMELK